MKRFGLMQSGVDTLKTFLSVIAIAYLGWLAVDAVSPTARACRG